jgi:hypothetical protein
VTVAVAAAGALLAGAGPARADDVQPTLTAFSVSPQTLDVTTGDGHITVLMSVSDPDATGVGTGSVIAHGPKRGYNPSGNLVQVGGTATDTQYRADITVPGGKAVDYRMDLSFLEADQFTYSDLQSQLAASGWPYHVQAFVTAAPDPARNIAFHRVPAAGPDVVDVTWSPPAAGRPVATGSVVTTTCGTVSSQGAHPSRLVGVPARSTCTVTVSLVNSAGSAAAVTATARV